MKIFVDFTVKLLWIGGWRFLRDLLEGEKSKFLIHVLYQFPRKSYESQKFLKVPENLYQKFLILSWVMREDLKNDDQMLPKVLVTLFLESPYYTRGLGYV